MKRARGDCGPNRAVRKASASGFHGGRGPSAPSARGGGARRARGEALDATRAPGAGRLGRRSRGRGRAFGRFADVGRAAALQRIVVVGGGLAGLTVAYRLKQAGIVADVYEASTRIGGRCWTIRDAFADSQIVEHGGELIDQGHKQMRQLESGERVVSEIAGDLK